jgi:hypothetical protein
MAALLVRWHEHLIHALGVLEGLGKDDFRRLLLPFGGQLGR